MLVTVGADTEDGDALPEGAKGGWASARAGASQRATARTAFAAVLGTLAVRTLQTVYSNSSRQRKSTPTLPTAEDETSLMLSYEPCTLMR
jgi:hypothetical protein